jgi:hypothetical protein
MSKTVGLTFEDEKAAKEEKEVKDEKAAKEEKSK